MARQGGSSDEGVDPEETYTGIKPVFFKNRDVLGTREGRHPGEYEVVTAVADIIGRDKVDGCQRIRGLWRIYCKTADARNTLITTKAIEMRGQSIELHSTNPFINSPRDPTKNGAKITVKDVPLSFSDDDIRHFIENLGAKLITEEVKYGFIRDDLQKLTTIKNGDRVLFADPDHLMQNPLPRFAMCGIFEARVYHRGQTGPAPRCRNCLKDDHFTNQCTNDRVCRICQKCGHEEGDNDCMYFENQTNTIAFAGHNDILSNMFPCSFEFMDITANSSEQAYQYATAVKNGQHDLAKKISRASNGYEAKRIGKYVIRDKDWNQNGGMEAMEQAVQAKIEQVPEVQDHLLSTEGVRLVEAVPGDSFWGSALNKQQTLSVKREKWLGKNRLGGMLSRIRDQMIAARKKDSKEKKRQLSEASKQANNQPHKQRNSFIKQGKLSFPTR